MIEASAIIRQAYVLQRPARSKGIAKTKCRGPRVSKGGSEARILLLAWIYRPPSRSGLRNIQDQGGLPRTYCSYASLAAVHSRQQPHGTLPRSAADVDCLCHVEHQHAFAIHIDVFEKHRPLDMYAEMSAEGAGRYHLETASFFGL